MLDRFASLSLKKRPDDKSRQTQLSAAINLDAVRQVLPVVERSCAGLIRWFVKPSSAEALSRSEGPIFAYCGGSNVASRKPGTRVVVLYEKVSLKSREQALSLMAALTRIASALGAKLVLRPVVLGRDYRPLRHCGFVKHIGPWLLTPCARIGPLTRATQVELLKQ